MLYSFLLSQVGYHYGVSLYNAIATGYKKEVESIIYGNLPPNFDIILSKDGKKENLLVLAGDNEEILAILLDAYEESLQPYIGEAFEKAAQNGHNNAIVTFLKKCNMSADSRALALLELANKPGNAKAITSLLNGCEDMYGERYKIALMYSFILNGYDAFIDDLIEKCKYKTVSENLGSWLSMARKKENTNAVNALLKASNAVVDACSKQKRPHAVLENDGSSSTDARSERNKRSRKKL